jgi:RNA polymerase sigma-70 factor, ECF subfamily
MLSIDLRNKRGGMHTEEPSLPVNQIGLLSIAQSGDREAFGTLIEPHLHRFYDAAVRIKRNHEDAEDACQESMMKAFVHIQGFQDNAKFSTWLTRIVIKEALMTIRKMQMEGRYRSVEGDLFEMPFHMSIRDQNGDSDPEALCARAERKALMWETIDHLEVKSRSAVCMLGLEEKESWEIAEASQLSRSGMRSRLQRALQKLHAMLTDELGASLPLAVVERKS